MPNSCYGMTCVMEMRATAMPGQTTPKGWHSRGYLPHFDTPDVFQAVTFRLNDSLPQAVWERRDDSLDHRPPRFGVAALRRAAIETALDAGHGSCILRDPPVATLVQEALMAFHGRRYWLAAWVIMPNHVHALLQPWPGTGLSGILHSWKSYSAKGINALLGRTGPVWQRDYFDRFIRDAAHYERAAAYIRNNPVTAGLVDRLEDWPFGSAVAEPRRLEAGAPREPEQRSEIGLFSHT